MSRGWRTACFIFALWAAAGIASQAQTFTNLVTFDITNGAYPYGTLVQGLDGNFYGTTSQGNGRNQCVGGCGTVFKITPQGTLTTLHNFDKTDGAYPVAGLVLGTDGNFYGSTFGDPSPQSGNEPLPSFIFEITPNGTLTNLATNTFSAFALMQNAVDGAFYGTSSDNLNSSQEAGEVFSITQSGTLKVLHHFCGQPSCGGIAKGSSPQAPLIQGSDLFMYGTTQSGGVAPSYCHTVGCGTVFKVGTGGNITTLHAFGTTLDDGVGPQGALAEGSDGNFYGATPNSGLGYGTVFKMTPSGELTTLYRFCSVGACTDGGHPLAGLIQATDGNFYGTTAYGGNGDALGCRETGCGTIFKITPAGALTTLLSFDTTDGMVPSGGLVQGTDGNLYGTTTGQIGLHLYGTVFKLSLGLPPFVKTLPTAAYPGTTIFILGTDLTGATAVSFNGKVAAFTVVSATEITATVPKGSTTGTVEVTTPSGMLSSNIAFRVF